jgi:hypothetical protein
MTRRIKARDRGFAVICFGVALARSGRKDAAAYLGEVLSEAITTGSALLIHDVLRGVDERGGRTWSRFVGDVARKAAQHRGAEATR